MRWSTHHDGPLQVNEVSQLMLLYRKEKSVYRQSEFPQRLTICRSTCDTWGQQRSTQLYASPLLTFQKHKQSYLRLDGWYDHWMCVSIHYCILVCSFADLWVAHCASVIIIILAYLNRKGLLVLINIMKSTEVQTLGELRTHGTTNWWAGLLYSMCLLVVSTLVARGESDTD